MTRSFSYLPVGVSFILDVISKEESISGVILDQYLKQV